MSLEKLIEEQISKAMAEGAFDDLPGKGKPLDLEAYFQTPEHLRLGYSVLKNGDFVPAEVQLLKEIEALKAQLDACADEEQRRRLSQMINDKTLTFRMLMERPQR